MTSITMVRPSRVTSIPMAVSLTDQQYSGEKKNGGTNNYCPEGLEWAWVVTSE